MKTAILICGCHLEAVGWKSIIWGNPDKNILGRVPRAIEFIKVELGSHFPEFIYWGTGASEKEGIVESEYTFDFTIKMLQEERDCNRKIVDLLQAESYLDTKAQSTLQEVEGAMNLCYAKGVRRLVLVSSPTHIARGLQSAEIVRAKFNHLRAIKLMAVSSDTCYSGSSPADVLIVEPAHRGDRADIPLNKILKKALFARKLSPQKARVFQEELLSFLEKKKKDLAR